MPWELCKAEVLINSAIYLLNLCRWFANIKTVLKLEYPAWKLVKKINNIFCFFQQDYGVDRRIAWQVYKMLCYFFLSTTVTSLPNFIWVNSFFDCSGIMSFKSIFFFTKASLFSIPLSSWTVLHMAQKWECNDWKKLQWLLSDVTIKHNISFLLISVGVAVISSDDSTGGNPTWKRDKIFNLSPIFSDFDQILLKCSY